MATLSRARLIAAVGAAASVGPRVVLAQQLEKIVLAGVPSEDLTPFFYAIKSGLYQRAGLDVSFVATSSGSAATTAVVAGTYQMGKGSVIATLNAHLRGLPIRIVANGVLWDPRAAYTLVMVAADSPLKTAADLNGKVGAAAAIGADIGQLTINVWMDKNGGDSKSVKWVEVPNSVSEEALIQHRVDFTCLNEPELAAAREHGKVRVFADTYTAIANRFVVTAYLANAEWVAQHPEAVRRFARTTYEASAYTNAHHAETEALMADVTKIPLEVIHKMVRGICATTSDTAMLQPVIDTAAKYGTIARAFSAREVYANV